MSATASFLNSKAGQYAALGVVAVIGVVVLYKFLKGELTAAATFAGSLVTGNNALTQGTPYQGAGVAGTLGAATNVASGGALQSVGEWLGGSIFDLTHSTPATAPATAKPPIEPDVNNGVPAKPPLQGIFSYTPQPSVPGVPSPAPSLADGLIVPVPSADVFDSPRRYLY